MVDTVDRFRQSLDTVQIAAAVPYATHLRNQQAIGQAVINQLAAQYHILNRNRIKPGIAEATRAVLRRVPDHVLVRSKTDPDVALLMHLAAQKDIQVKEMGDTLGQYRAVTIIRKVS